MEEGCCFRLWIDELAPHSARRLQFIVLWNPCEMIGGSLVVAPSGFACQRFRNQVFHPFKASDSIGAFGLAPCGEQIRIVILFLLFVVILYNV